MGIEANGARFPCIIDDILNKKNDSYLWMVALLSEELVTPAFVIKSSTASSFFSDAWFFL